jgi:anti-anti-sigma factor
MLEAAVASRDDSDAVVIDLANVTFIDSSGLRALLDAARRARARSTDVVLRSVGPEVFRLLEITGTAGQFSIDGRRD